MNSISRMHSVHKSTKFNTAHSRLQTTRIQARHYTNGISRVPEPFNEPVCEYKKGTKMRAELDTTLLRMKSEQLDVPLIINGQEVRTGDKGEMRIPYKHAHKLGTFHRATKKEVEAAIQSSLNAREKWASLDFESRAAIFLKIADLISGEEGLLMLFLCFQGEYRHVLNAATILGQSKNFFQSEIDAVCEFADFVRFNVKFASDIYTMEQPISTKSWWNKMEYRPLEGFVYAVSPFNFTAIGGNLSLAPALMGNVVVWKPSDYAIYSNYQIMKICKAAGLPDGVLNFIPGDAEMISNVVLSNPQLAGLHYTGSTAVMKSLWKKIGNNIDIYKSYPRIVGESGGKDFIFAHKSAHVDALVTAMIRGAFEFCGQKCSAASRAYIPSSIWPTVKERLLTQMKQVKMGDPEDDANFVNAVIHKNAFQRIKSYIEYARESKDHQILFGGKCDDSVGYFIEPTIVQTANPKSKLIMEEIFGPVLTVYVYEDADIATAVKHCDDHQFALTGSIFAQDRYAIVELSKSFVNSAGNFYINDKPTGAIVGQQPFGGARLSGTNDKAGCYLNLLRWCSPRTIKETHNPPTHWAYL